MGHFSPPEVPAIKNMKPFERIRFPDIMQAKDKFQFSHKKNLIMLEVENLAGHNRWSWSTRRVVAIRAEAGGW